MQELVLEHLSEDLLWSAIKKRQTLDKRYIAHTRDCRDCREFVPQLSLEAQTQGFSFPDLLFRKS